MKPDSEVDERGLRSLIRAEVRAIAPCDQLERDHRAATLAWIDTGGELFRREKPATPPQHLVSYFVCVDARHLLLVDHRDAGLWLPTGGHVEPGEHPRATVQRELQEELGVSAPFANEAPLLVTITETVGISAGHRDVSLWYVVALPRAARIRFDVHEFRDVHWFPFDALPTQRTDPHLSRFVAKLARFQDERSARRAASDRPRRPEARPGRVRRFFRELL